MYLPILCIVILTTLLCSSLCTAKLIPLLRKKKMGQCILDIGPAWHKSKEGTPSMGGIVFLFLIPIASLLSFFLLRNGESFLPLLFILLYMISNGLIGLFDDLTKFKNQRNKGLLPWQKLLLQSLCAFLFVLAYEMHIGTLLPLQTPFGVFSIPIGFAGFFLLLFVMVGTVNCANLTDGVDGLAGAVAFLLSLFFATEGAITQNASLLALGLVSAPCLLGFLLFNRHPARIFMGDTGSLFLGAFAIAGAFLLERPLSVLVFGFIYILEGISVVLQVLVFKRTGKRLFRMAPLHHHFEKKGWSENKIVYFALAFTTLFTLLFHFLAR